MAKKYEEIFKDGMKKLNIDLFDVMPRATEHIPEQIAMVKTLEEKGYNPVSQIVGYILSEDPTYITTHNNARNLVRKIDRDELMQILVKKYLDKK